MTKRISRIIVFSGNRSGVGQTASAAHVAVGLMRLGHAVGTVDADGIGRGLTLWRDVRRERGVDLPLPYHHVTDGEIDLRAALDDMADCAFIIIDAGPDTRSPAHAMADTLVSVAGPGVNDLNLVAYGDTPSPYSLMVEEQSVARVMDGAPPLHWIVMRNRLVAPDTADAVGRLSHLAAAFGFYPLAGLSERPLIAELTARGRTLLDIKDGSSGKALDVATLAARQEARAMIAAIVPARPRKKEKS